MIAVTLQATLAAFVLVFPPLALWRSAELRLVPKLAADLPLAWRLAVGFGLGSGFLSAAYFLGVAVFQVPPRAYMAGECLGACLVWLWAGRARRPKLPGASPSRPDRPARAVVLSCAALLALFVASFVTANPYYGWDAYQQVNHRALSLVHNIPCLYQALVYTSHGDYPLLLPGVLARIYAAVPLRHWAIPGTVALAFTLATFTCVVQGVSVLRTSRVGALAGLALVGPPAFALTGALQFSDMPLAFYAVTALVLFALAEKRPDPSGWTAALGFLCLALGAWTKNEGLVLAPAMAGFWWGWDLIRGWGAPDAGRVLRRAALLCLPCLAALVVLKASAVVGNDQFNASRLGVLATLAADPARHLEAARLLLRFTLESGAFSWPAGLFALLAVLARPSGLYPRARLCALGTCLVLLGAYFLSYVVTSWTMADHVRSSWDRLVVHLWPCLVVWTCLARDLPTGLAPGKSPA